MIFHTQYFSVTPALTSGTKKCSTPTIDEEDDSDSSSDEEPWAAPVVQRGQGKQLRPPPTSAAE